MAVGREKKCRYSTRKSIEDNGLRRKRVVRSIIVLQIIISLARTVADNISRPFDDLYCSANRVRTPCYIIIIITIIILPTRGIVRVRLTVRTVCYFWWSCPAQRARRCCIRDLKSNTYNIYFGYASSLYTTLQDPWTERNRLRGYRNYSERSIVYTCGIRTPLC